MKVTYIIGLALLLANCQLGYGKSAPVTKATCPPGPIPDGCPFPDHALSTFFPHANDCHWFFHCSNGVPYCKECPANLHWNQALETCDYPERAGCSVSGGETTQKPNPPSTATPKPTTAAPKPTTSAPKPTTAAPKPTTSAPKPTTAAPKPTTEKPAPPASTPSPSTCPAGAVPNCPFPDPALSVFFPHENDCHWFFHCSNGVAYCKKCPADLHWNPILDTCDRPENAGCNSGSGATTTKKPDPPTTVAPKPTTAEPRPTTSAPKPTTSAPKPTSAAPKPTTSAPKPTTAAPNPTTSAPKPTTSAPKPTTEKPAPPASTPSPSTCPAGIVPNCPFPDPALSVFFPHENDCHWFFHCSNGVAYCKECPADLHWNPVLDTCDRPENAGCNSGSGESTTKKPDRPTTSAPKPTTAAPKPTTSAPKPTTAAPKPTTSAPKPTTAAPNPTTSAPKPTTSAPKPTTEKPAPPASTPSPSTCPAGAVPNCPFPDPALSVFFPHENDCHWFFHCSNGVAYCKKCPADLHWNPVLNTCDRPENAGCNSGSGESTTKKPDRPTTSAPKPTTAAPKPTTSAPKPTTAAPKPTTLAPKPTTAAPNPTTSAPKPTTSAPKPTTEKPAPPASTPSPSTCPAGAVPNCPFPDPALSVFFPHENDCHWFFHCSNGVAYCKKCPADLHWNPVLNTCDRPENAGCGSGSGASTTKKPDPPTTVAPKPTTAGPRPTTSAPKPTTSAPKPTTAAPKPTTSAPKPTTEKPAPPASTTSPSTCPAGAVPSCPFPDPALSVFFPHENDCHWFFHCSNGVAYCKKCPADLHWNPVLNTCDRPENAGCGSGSIPTTSKPVPTLSTHRPVPPGTTQTPVPTLSTHRPVPTSTTQRPIPNSTTKRPVPTSTTQRPVPPSSTHAPIRTTQDPSACPPGKVPTCPFPDPAFSVFFPHENNCHWFYHCSNGVAYCKVCPANLHWNPDKNTCDYSYRAGCT